ncbi:MAG: transposase [Candidatus Sericytochromatia bacterium]|nr:transposase [Candidatus Tanganyikabacteria bacterium]
MPVQVELDPVSKEFEGADLGDKRLTRRLKRLADAAESAPGAGFPTQAGSDAALEGTYRFLNNPGVTPEAHLAPHVSQTVERASAAEVVLVVHDTTSFQFDGDSQREGLGRIRGYGQGFIAHFALAVGADGSRKPLGVLGMRTHFRTEPPKGSEGWRDRLARTDRESNRWLDLATVAGNHVAGRAEAVHVMDREGDSYELLAGLISGGHRFIIRLDHDRKLNTAAGKDSEMLRKLYATLAALVGRPKRSR